MKAKTHFAFRIDAWDTTGDNVVEQLAGLECALRGRRYTKPHLLGWTGAG